MDFMTIASHELEMLGLLCMANLLLLHTLAILKINLPWKDFVVPHVALIYTASLDFKFLTSSSTRQYIYLDLVCFCINFFCFLTIGFILSLPCIFRTRGVGFEMLLVNDDLGTTIQQTSGPAGKIIFDVAFIPLYVRCTYNLGRLFTSILLSL